VAHTLFNLRLSKMWNWYNVMVSITKMYQEGRLAIVLIPNEWVAICFVSTLPMDTNVLHIKYCELSQNVNFLSVIGELSMRYMHV
jgi:hypothetical protein